MKQLLILSFVISSLLMKSQTVDGVPISEIKGPYVEVALWKMGYLEEIPNFKSYAFVFYGQKLTKQEFEAESELLDNDGEPILFDHQINLINQMDKWGFEYIEQRDSQGAVHYLFKKDD